jgi:hypothetical protein
VILVVAVVALGPSRVPPGGTAPPSPGGTFIEASTEPASGPPIGPSTGPSSGPSTGPVKPTLAGTSSIVSAVNKLEYSCNDPQSLSTNGPSAGPPVRESVVCKSPKSAGPFLAAIIAGESSSGEVVIVWLKGSIEGSDRPSSRDALAIALARLAALSFGHEDDGRLASDFVLLQLRLMEPGSPAMTKDIPGARLTLERLDDGSYFVTIEAET